MIKKRIKCMALLAVSGAVILAAAACSRSGESGNRAESSAEITSFDITSSEEETTKVQTHGVDETSESKAESTDKIEAPTTGDESEKKTTVSVTSTKETEKATERETKPDNSDPSYTSSFDGEGIKFSFNKILVENDTYDYYSYMIKNGYTRINSLSELSAFCEKNVLNVKSERKIVTYIVTSLNKFDDVTTRLSELNKELSYNKTAINQHNKDVFLYDKLGLDFQKYYTNGIAIFEMKKIQNIVNKKGKYSVYALYSYSYTTREQNILTESTVETIAAGFTGTELEKITQAYQYFIEHVSYSQEPKLEINHSAYSAAVFHTTVCDGFSKMFKMLMDRVGIECRVVYSIDHAWNEILYNGEWYIVDVTFGVNEKNNRYLLLGADVLMATDKVILDGYTYSLSTISGYGYNGDAGIGNKNLALASVSFNRSEGT